MSKRLGGIKGCMLLLHVVVVSHIQRIIGCQPEKKMCVCVFIKLHITAQSGPVIYSFYATVCNPPGGYLS